MEDINIKISLEELANLGWKSKDLMLDLKILEREDQRILYDCEMQQIFYTYNFK